MWDRIKPLLPADPVRGRRWADHRRALGTHAWKYRTRSPWRDRPDEHASAGWGTLADRADRHAAVTVVARPSDRVRSARVIMMSGRCISRLRFDPPPESNGELPEQLGQLLKGSTRLSVPGPLGDHRPVV
ncbi:transposase [Streptomyces sp. NPDC051665]|uniref:transposase n=1 Tax=Streptomyces sp. NPDC051665 TaxID=3154647 RepID=UPI00344113E2